VRIIPAFVLRLLAPGFGSCGRCGVPWKFVEEHDTKYSSSGGCFPLCESCWSALTIPERLPYYRDLMYTWETQRYHAKPPAGWEPTHEKWPAIKQAVLAGL
jgi:hypothetical protein